MSLSQLADLACASKRPFSAMQYIEQLALPQDYDEELPRKKVRFAQGADAAKDEDVDQPCSAAPETSPRPPQELKQLMEKVHRRAERRRNMISLGSSASVASSRTRSPPPPVPVQQQVTTVSPTNNNNSALASTPTTTLAAMQLKLQRMEHAIQKSARAELQLMNQSKRLRDKRAKMTRRYESMAAQMAEMQAACAVPMAAVFQMGVLPPLMEQPLRRVSVSPDQIINLTCHM